jgi:hypothetical protein
MENLLFNEKNPDTLKGHGFSRAVKAAKKYGL